MSRNHQRTWIAKGHFPPVRCFVKNKAREFGLKHKQNQEMEKTAQRRKIAKMGMESV